MADPLYSAEQIKIPADLPEILKNYAKYIIKTQPTDTLTSSAEYFSRLCKQRSTANGGKQLSNMQLEAFYSKFASLGERGAVTRKEIEEGASAANISTQQVQDILALGGWTADRVPWFKFWAFLCASAAGTLLATVELVCSLVGDNGRVSVSLVQEVFTFLAEQDRSIDATVAGNVIRALSELSPKEHPIPPLLDAIRNEFTTKPADAEEEGHLSASASGAGASGSSADQVDTSNATQSEEQGTGSVPEESLSDPQYTESSSKDEDA